MKEPTQAPIFDYRQIRRAFNRAAASYDEHAVLQNEVGRRLLQRLDWIKVNPEVVLDVGAGTGGPTARMLSRYPRASIIALDVSVGMLQRARRRRHWFRRPLVVGSDARQIPLIEQSVDMVFSNLVLQWCDQPDQVFKEICRVLKPDGVFIFSTFGPDTLKELRTSWANVDDQQHVHPFMDMHDIGDLLIHAGLQEPVMEREEIILTYDDIRGVMNDLRHIGAGNALNTRPRGLMGKERFSRLEQAYEMLREDGRLPATYEVIYGTVWSGRSDRPDVVNVAVEDIGRPRSRR